MKKFIMATGLSFFTLLVASVPVLASEYVIDTQGAHAFVQFKIKHLGYSWLLGRFNTFEGEFSYSVDTPKKSSISIEIATKSLDSNHAERDKHLKGKDFLQVDKYPLSTFKSTQITFSNADNALVAGDFMLHGVTKRIQFPIQRVGEGSDPWGGYRAGFEGTLSLKLADYGITYDLGPASANVDIYLYVEGIRQ